MIKRYTTPEAYVAAGIPTDESRVAQIEQTSEVKIDGVNVVVPLPGDGDAVFEDAEGNVKFVRWNTIQKNLLDQTWTHVGFAFGFDGRKVKVMAKDENTGLKWLNCWQFSISAISATTIKFYLHMKGDYAAWVPIEVELTSAEINATSASEISAAIEAAGNTGNVGYANHGYWAFLADADGNKVESDGTQIIVQCDFCADYRQYQCSDSTHALVGCTMALSVYGDMPASTALWRRTGCSDDHGVMNVAKAEAYFAASGSTPTSAVGLAATTIVNKSSFETSAHCAALRAAYGTYHNYIVMNRVQWPHPDRGVFGLIDADEMTRRYAALTFTKKDGTTVDWKFPALHYGLTVGYGSGAFATGRWHLSDITDGMEYMSDVPFKKIVEAQTRMNTTVLTNSANRWFARRCTANYAWLFHGTSGTLTTSNVYASSRCRAVTLYTVREAD